ncbi:LPXTG-site transpeptidase (sortase) family protein [Herbihabitans rhizosphaerae]|uniref:LPXTG-site transpeptidase (Sortase) family protein n=1 Tax=Herbihabitans rhizosphaerae TaxID=1872711 RepID=A0A4Q7KLN1_9PSEU|nr:class E sortase [Herbihabitans rhizosphaerae]RZS37549.1 LPXTG-site transpeptidase (sortase) family protein [Herbihabitans rhizosphaerae]
MDTAVSPAAPEQPPPPERDSRGRTVVRTIGEVLITLGLVVLLFVVYEVYVTDWFSAGKQRDANAALEERWKAPPDPERSRRIEVTDGEAFARMYVPSFGADYQFAILEGTDDKSLEIGPGHYKGTALPGLPGNFAIAGHRVGKGAPFNDIDLLNSCDAIIVETHASWFVYRVLPKADEVAGWPAKDQRRPKCRDVEPLWDRSLANNKRCDPVLGQKYWYRDTVGQEIVRPEDGSVISPVPHCPSVQPSFGPLASLLTLTTCHPRFSDRQRLIVHAVMTSEIPKSMGIRPPEFTETS